MHVQLLDKLIQWRTKISPRLIGGMPRRVKETYDRFDVLRGYAKYLKYCQQRMRRSIPDIDTALHKDGIEILRFLQRQEAQEAMQRAYALAKNFSARRNTGNRLYFEIDDEGFFDELLEKIFHDDVDARIIRYFGSEYVPYWYVIQESRPGSKPSNSFLWHCDRGPQKWLKILLYFTPTKDTGGSTLVLDKAQSELVARADYTFCKTSERTADIKELERRVGQPLKVINPQIDAGEGILFEPSRIMHRGLIPDKAPRVIMQIQILPSPIPWREALQRLRRAQLPEREELAFPHHARRLQAILA